MPAISWTVSFSKKWQEVATSIVRWNSDHFYDWTEFPQCVDHKTGQWTIVFCKCRGIFFDQLSDCYRFRAGPRAGWPRCPVTCSKVFMVPSLKCPFPGGEWLLGQVIGGNCNVLGSLSPLFVDARVSSTDNSLLFIGVIPCITHGFFHVRCRRQRY